MSEAPFTRPRAVPNGPQAQQPQGQEPDYLAYAADQLRRAHVGVTAMAKGLEAEGGEGSKDVIGLRLQIAAGYTELAAIQYSLPEEEDDPQGEGDAPW